MLGFSRVFGGILSSHILPDRRGLSAGVRFYQQTRAEQADSSRVGSVCLQAKNSQVDQAVCSQTHTDPQGREHSESRQARQGVKARQAGAHVDAQFQDSTHHYRLEGGQDRQALQCTESSELIVVSMGITERDYPEFQRGRCRSTCQGSWRGFEAFRRRAVFPQRCNDRYRWT